MCSQGWFHENNLKLKPDIHNITPLITLEYSELRSLMFTLKILQENQPLEPKIR